MQGKARCMPIMEGLESRLLLDGTVMVSVAGSTLKIMGDNMDNDVAISQIGDNFVVQGLNGTAILNNDTLTGIENILIKMRNGDDTVTLASDIDIDGKFVFDGSAGDDALITAGAFKADGSVIVSGTDTDAVAASGTLGIDSSVVITDANEAAGNVVFTGHNGIAAVGFVKIENLTAQAAVGGIDITDFDGDVATATLGFNLVDNVEVGTTVTLSDGVDEITFTAVEAGEDDLANEFAVGADTAATIANLEAKIDAHPTLDIDATDNGDSTMTLDQENAGDDGNTTIGLTFPGDTTIAAVDFAGGADAVGVGDEIIISDGTVAVAFVCVANGTAAEDNEFDIEATADDTLDNLKAALDAVAGAGNLDITAAQPGIGGGDHAITLANDNDGAAGNVDIVLDSGAAWAIVGMAGGADAFEAGATVTLDDGINAPVTFTAIALGEVPAVETEFAIGANAGATMTNLSNAVLAYEAAADAGTFLLTSNGVGGNGVELQSTIGATQDWTNALGNQAIATTGAEGQWTVVDLGDADNGGTAGVNGYSMEDGDTIVLDDGVTEVTFTAGTDFAIGTTEQLTAQNFRDAVNASALTVTATINAGDDTQVDLVNYALFSDDANTAIVTTDFDAGGDNDAAPTDFAGGQAASIVTTVDVTVGDWVVLDDGVNEQILIQAVDSTPAAGTPRFEIGATVAETAMNLVNAINGLANLDITATLNADNTIALVNDATGEVGNTVISVNAGGGILDVDGEMTGGAEAVHVNIADGATVTIDDGVADATLTAGTDFAVGATVAETATNIADAINASGLGVTATAAGGLVTVINDTAGFEGNQAIIVTDANGNLDADGMDGGAGGSLTAGSLLAKMGSGDNQVELGGGAIAGGTTIVGAGKDGSDDIAIDSMELASVRIQLGKDSSTFSIDNTDVTGNFLLKGGAGDDMMLIDQLGTGGSTFADRTIFKTNGGADLILDDASTAYTLDAKNVLRFLGKKGDEAMLNDDGEIFGTSVSNPVYKYVDGAL